jgi:hypothetical protein
MALECTYNPETGEAELTDRGNGGHTVSSEELGRLNPYTDELELYEQADASYREVHGDWAAELAEADRFALAASFELSGGEALVREAIGTAQNWLPPTEVERYNNLVDELAGSGEFSALQPIFTELVQRYLEAQGAAQAEDDGTDPEAYEDPRDFTDESFQEEAAEYVDQLDDESIDSLIDLWDSVPYEGAQAAVQFASQFNPEHPIHLTAQAMCAAVHFDDQTPMEVFEDLIDILGEEVALASFATIFSAINQNNDDY